ncbi:8989_t:CDS:2 [Cetraspora pellucida]|uniref:8989_t:CDS:1 n=1 Tax=Cetraspora pellucida TaxID=1433469 RepID=A0A9N9JWZ8_9GLOM|nr:8989_t:CDS:2 [Cetraspora pellucida]
MADAINNLLSNFNIKDKTLALITDNESAKIVCGKLITEELQHEFDEIRFSHYHYAAHVLNLTAKQRLRMVCLSIEKVQNLMSKIRVSTCLCDDLHGLYKLKGIPYFKPELDVDTRWNSMYYILQKIKKIETSLKLLAADHPSIDLLYPNINEQQNLKDMLILLELIETITKLLLASSYPTIDTYIEKEEFSQYLAATSICQKIKTYWGIMDEPFVVSAVLDLRAKFKIFNKEEAINAKKMIKEIMNQYIYEYQQTLSVSNNEEESLIKTTQKFFWKWHNKSETVESLVPNYTNEESTITNELNYYIAMETIEENTIPLE